MQGKFSLPRFFQLLLKCGLIWNTNIPTGIIRVLSLHAGATHEEEKWSVGGYVYSENDVKNQPLQQNLSEEQAQILVNAGDNPDLMTAPSAYIDSYSENKILYKKVIIGRGECIRILNE